MKCAVCPAEAETNLGMCLTHDSQFRDEAREAAERLKANPDDAEAEKLARSIANNHVRLVAREMTGMTLFRGMDVTAPDFFQKLRAKQAAEKVRQQAAPEHEQRTAQAGILEDYE